MDLNSFDATIFCIAPNSGSMSKEKYCILKRWNIHTLHFYAEISRKDTKKGLKDTPFAK